jgi:UDP-GlcNAc:undecaprenyl-phosphate GlcNAc-1-phosphate transferase
MTSFVVLTLAVFAFTTCLSAAIVPTTRKLAGRLGALDAPGKRKIHHTPTPRMGGVAVYVAFVGVVLIGFYAATVVIAHGNDPALVAFLKPLEVAHLVQGKLLAVVVGATVAFMVGLLDDTLGTRFPVWMKALGQLAAAVILILGDVRTSFMPYEFLNHLVTILWIFGIANAFNLLDNMDGLCAGVAFVASAVLFLNAWALGEMLVCLIFAAFLGSLLGFLFYNYNPASVFLGDCGSLFIGYMMAALTLLERYVSNASSTLFPVFMPVLVLAIPLIDTTTVVIIRLKEHRPIYVGDTRHLSHRLVSLGFSQRAAVLFIYLATLCFGLGAIGLTDAGVARSWLIMAQSIGFMALILILLFFERRKQTREATT